MMKEMNKKLSEMSLEELWQPFPIYLIEHNESWAAWYAEEEMILKEHLPAGRIRQISHIGSTAVKGIWAKPIIEMIKNYISLYKRYTEDKDNDI